MPTNRRLGRLIISWGPQPADGPERFERIRALRKDVHEPLHTFDDFHAHALNDDPDPFASRYFGQAVKKLLSRRTVVLTDGAFDDPRRRDVVERAFRQTLPDLTVDQVGRVSKGRPEHLTRESSSTRMSTARTTPARTSRSSSSRMPRVMWWCSRSSAPPNG